MRLFLALDLPAELHEWIEQRQKELKRCFSQPGLRWMPSEQWHMTLRFLGEWPEHKTAAILTAMKQAAKDMPPFSISFGKPGSFSGPRMGVLWIGLETGSGIIGPVRSTFKYMFGSRWISEGSASFSSARDARAQSGKNTLDSIATFSGSPSLPRSDDKPPTPLSKHPES